MARQVGQQQYDWLERDLAVARRNATLAPWILVYSHYPMYCSNGPSGDCGLLAGIMRNGIGAYIVMAFVAMAQTVMACMAYLDIAYIVLAYVVMAYVVMACIGTGSAKPAWAAALPAGSRCSRGTAWTCTSAPTSTTTSGSYPRVDLFLPTFRRMPMANAGSWIESEGSVGRVAVRRAFRYLQIEGKKRSAGVQQIFAREVAKDARAYR